MGISIPACCFLPAGRGWRSSGCSKDSNGEYLWKAENQRVNHGVIHGSVAPAAAAVDLTGADDAFGLAQEVPVRGHAEVAGALEMKERIRATKKENNNNPR